MDCDLKQRLFISDCNTFGDQVLDYGFFGFWNRPRTKLLEFGNLGSALWNCCLPLQILLLALTLSLNSNPNANLHSNLTSDWTPILGRLYHGLIPWHFSITLTLTPFLILNLKSNPDILQLDNFLNMLNDNNFVSRIRVLVIKPLVQLLVYLHVDWLENLYFVEKEVTHWLLIQSFSCTLTD